MVEAKGRGVRQVAVGLFVAWSVVIAIATWVTWSPLTELAKTLAESAGVWLRACLFLPVALVERGPAILWVGAMLYAQWALGGWLSRALATRRPGAVLDHVERIVLGQGAHGVAVFLLAALGALSALTLSLLVVLPAIARLALHRDVRTIAETILSFARRVRGQRARRAPPPSLPVALLRAGTGAVIAVFLAVGLLTALHPVWFYDVLAYHFGTPVQWLADGGFRVNELDVLSFVPGHAEALTAIAMAGSGFVAGQLVAFSYLPLLLAWAGVSRCGSLRGSRIARLLIVTAPVVVLTASQSKPDVGLMLYAAVAVDRTLIAARSARPIDALYAGLFTGVAAATKYTAVPLVLGPSALLALVLAVRTHRDTSLSAGLLSITVWLGGILLVVGPWLIRNAVWTGNPIYPGAYALLGGPQWSEAQAALLRSEINQRALSDLRLDDIWTVLWRLTFSSWQVLVDRFGEFGVLGPAFLWLLPAALWRIGDVRETRYTWLVIGVSLVLSLTFVWVLRYAAIVLPWFAVLIGRGVRGTGRTTLSIVATAVVATLGVAANLTYVMREALERSEQMATIAGGASDVDLLTSMSSRHPIELGTYALMRRLDDIGPDGRVLVVGDTVHAYLHAPHTHASALNRPAIAPYLASGRTPMQVADALTAAGYSHVLYNPDQLARVASRAPELGLTAREEATLQALLGSVGCIAGDCGSGPAVYRLRR